eukprot:364599-Chlamydomonas_euryale.AAC.23
MAASTCKWILVCVACVTALLPGALQQLEDVLGHAGTCSAVWSHVLDILWRQRHASNKLYARHKLRSNEERGVQSHEHCQARMATRKSHA